MKRTILLLASLLVALCSSSSRAGETNAITSETTTNSLKDISEEIKAGYSNFNPVVSSMLGTNYGPTVVQGLASAKTNVLKALTNSALPEIGRAHEFLVALKNSGRLPGVAKDSHGDVSVNGPLSAFQEAQYPFTVTFDVVVGGDSLTNHYEVVRPANDAAWQLEKAWRTDTQGHTNVVWLPKSASH